MRNSHRTGNARCGSDIGVGDVTFIHKQGVQRGLWTLGLVEELLPSSYGSVRSATVKCSTNDGHPSRLCRPIQRLHPVEVISRAQSAADDVGAEQLSTATPPVAGLESSLAAPARPIRAGGRRAQQLRHSLIDAGRV